MSAFGTVLDTSIINTGSGGGGGTVDAVARADIAAITGTAGDTIAAGETTWIPGIGPFLNDTGSAITIPSPATEANMITAGFTKLTQIEVPAPRVISADDTVQNAEHVVGSSTVGAITVTIASGVEYFWVSRPLDMAFDVIVVSADAPTITVADDATGANLNEPAGPVLFIKDTGDPNNFLAVTNGIAYEVGGGDGIVQSTAGALAVDGTGALTFDITTLPDA